MGLGATRHFGFAVAVAVAAAVAGLPGWEATGAELPRATVPVNVTSDDLGPARTYASPSIAIDPDNPLRVVASYVELRTKRCGLMRSSDGGQTWARLEASPSPASYPFCSVASQKAPQAALAFGRNGALYYAFLGWDTQDGGTGGNISVFVARSDDLGDTWSTTAVRDARGKQEDEREQNRPLGGLAVDRRTGDEDIVYVAWVRRPNNTRDTPFLPFASVSTDGGRTFSGPANLVANAFETEAVRSEALRTAGPNPPQATGADFGGLVSTVTVDEEGTAYFAWTTITPAKIQPVPMDAIYLTRTTDKGRTFQSSQIVPFSEVNPGRGFQGSFGSPSLAWSSEGGPEGSLHLVTIGTENPGIARQSDIHHHRSVDGGATWTGPTVLNDDDRTQLFVHVIPKVSAAPDGRLDAAWFDTRADPGTTGNDVYYSSSADGGVTWSANIRMSDRTIDRKIGTWANNSDTNGPPGLASSSAHAIVGWDDTQNGDSTGQAQDIYVGAVQYRTIGANSSPTLYALAAVAGLAFVGLVLAGFALTSRRRSVVQPADRAGVGGRETANL